MKKLFLFILFSSMGLSLYPAEVTIVNKTNELVFARLNNQRRKKIFYKYEKRGQGWPREMTIISSVLTAGVALPFAETTAAARLALGFPNFVPITQNSSNRLATIFFKSELAEGDYAQAYEPYGAPISKITFLRVIGHKTITGTLPELKKQIKPLKNQYGNIDLSIKDHIYRDDLSGAQALPLFGKHRYSIQIPIIEKFTYDLGENKIPRFELNAKVELQKWGKARRVW